MTTKDSASGVELAIERAIAILEMRLSCWFPIGVTVLSRNRPVRQTKLLSYVRASWHPRTLGVAIAKAR